MTYVPPPENISVYINGHGTFTTSPASLDLMIEKYLRPTVEEMRAEMRDYLNYIDGEGNRYDDLTARAQYLMLWAEFNGLATR